MGFAKKQNSTFNDRLTRFRATFIKKAPFTREIKKISLIDFIFGMHIHWVNTISFGVCDNRKILILTIIWCISQLC